MADRYATNQVKMIYDYKVLYTGNTRAGINSWIDIGIMFDNLDIYF
jgi:hypothetical protein